MVEPVCWWLMKTEPDVFGLADLRRLGVAPWDGVRNYQARNFMRAMRLGDRVFIYHSNASPSGIAGLATVARTAYPDHTAWDPSNEHFDPKSTPGAPRWDMVDLRFDAELPRFLPLDLLRATSALASLPLFTHVRLSVQPVPAKEAAVIRRLAQTTA